MEDHGGTLMDAMMKSRQVMEGVKRMKALGIMRQTIREFEKEGVVNLSESGGYLYWLDEKEREMVANFESEHDCTVYHVIKSRVQLEGDVVTIYSLLFVSQWERDWGTEMKGLKGGEAYAYVSNVDMPDCSEFGTIGVQPSIGGLKRTW